MSGYYYKIGDDGVVLKVGAIKQVAGAVSSYCRRKYGVDMKPHAEYFRYKVSREGDKGFRVTVTSPGGGEVFWDQATQFTEPLLAQLYALSCVFRQFHVAKVKTKSHLVKERDPHFREDEALFRLLCAASIPSGYPEFNNEQISITPLPACGDWFPTFTPVEGWFLSAMRKANQLSRGETDRGSRAMWLTGAGVVGYTKAMSSISRTMESYERSKSDNDVWARSILFAGTLVGMRSVAVYAYDFSFSALLHTKIENTKAAGHLGLRPKVVVKDDVFNVEFKIDANGTKGDQLYNAALILEKAIREIEAYLEANPGSVPIWLLPYPIAKTNVKVEGKLGSDLVDFDEKDFDYDKVRIFFVVPLVQYIICSILFGPLHHQTANVGPNFIGFPWAYGGAKEFAKMTSDLDEEYPGRYGSGDVKNKDQSFPWHDLIMISSLVFTLIPKDHPKYGLLKTLVSWNARFTAGHVVRWLEHLFRLVLGTLFSGDYNTSFFNTFHMICAWVHYVMRNAKDPKTALNHPGLKFCAAGDDFFNRIPDDLPELSNEGFIDFLKTYHAQTVKPDSIITTKTLWSYPTETFEIDVEKSTQQKFLQCYFRPTPEGLVPWRPTAVYYRKITLWKPEMTPVKFASKLIGLAYDTRGSNPVAYKFLHDLYVWFTEEYNLNAGDFYSAWELNKPDVLRSMQFKWGLNLDVYDFCHFPTEAKLRQLFYTDDFGATLYRTRFSRDPRGYQRSALHI